MFTLPSSLKRRCPPPRGSRGTPPFQLDQRKGERRTDLSHNRQSFLATSSALLHCATPVQSTKYESLMEIRRACLGHIVVPSTSGARPSGRRVRWPKQVECLNGGRHGLLCRCQHQSLLNVCGHVLVPRDTSLKYVHSATRILASALCCDVTVTGLLAQAIVLGRKRSRCS